MKQITRDEIELKVLKYYSQDRINVFHNAPELNENNFELIVFPQLENYDAMGIRHLFRMVSIENTIHKYPQDWWNMFKARWFPSWIIAMFPIRNKTVTARHLFPYCREDLRKEVVKVIVSKEEVSSDS